MALALFYNEGTVKNMSIPELITERPYLEVNKLEKIVVDAEELAHIRHIFRANTYSQEITIPMIMHKHEMTWYGDMAKTIVANL